MFINIISIARTPAGLLNAGFDGRPKTTSWAGGRQRVSSQCQKAWLRTSATWRKLSEEIGSEASIRRPSHFNESFAAGLEAAGVHEAADWAKAAQRLFSSTEGTAPKVLGRKEVEAISNACIQLAGEGKSPSALEVHLKGSPLTDPADAGFDAAIFGRFSTSDAVITIRSAMHVSDALATSDYDPIDDFFSAQNDDPTKAGGSASHIADRELAPPSLFLRVAVIDLGQLAENLGAEADVATVAGGLVEAFLRSFTESGVASRGTYARTLEALVEVSERQPTTPIEAIRSPSDDPSAVWQRILAERAGEADDYGTPSLSLTLAECRGSGEAALEAMRERVANAVANSSGVAAE